MKRLEPLLSRRSAVATGYGVAVASVAAATVLRWLLASLLGDQVPFITFFLAVVVAAWYGGARPAVLAAVLGLLVAWFVFIPPRFSFEIERRSDLIGLFVYLVISLAIAGLGGAMRAAEQRARDAEQRTREGAELLRITLTSIGDAILTTDTRGNVMFLNPVAQQLTGWTQEEAAGKPFQAVLRMINEQTRKPAENPVEKVLKLGQVVGLVNHTVLINRNGTERPIDDSAAPVHDDQGRVIGVVMVFRDITERRRAEAQTREADERMRSVVDHVIDGIITIDAHGIVQTFNQAAERVFGYQAAEVIGQNAKLLMPEPYHAEHDGYVANYLRTGQAKIIGIGSSPPRNR